MKCPYCSTLVDDDLKRCPICNADLRFYEPEPCSVIPDENDYCAVHEEHDHKGTDIVRARQEYYEHHPKVKEIVDSNPQFREFVDKKLNADTEPQTSGDDTTKETFKKFEQHPVAGFFLALFFVILVVTLVANFGGLSPVITVVVIITTLLSLKGTKKRK